MTAGTVPAMPIERVVVLVNRSSGVGSGAGFTAGEITEAFGAVGVEALVDEVDPRQLPATIGLLWAGACLLYTSDAADE